MVEARTRTGRLSLAFPIRLPIFGIYNSGSQSCSNRVELDAIFNQSQRIKRKLRELNVGIKNRGTILLRWRVDAGRRNA